MMDMTTRTFFCGDLFTQGGSGEVALTEATSSDPAKRSARRWTTTRTRRPPQRFSNASHANNHDAGLHRGSAWRGDGAKLLRELGVSLAKTRHQLAA